MLANMPDGTLDATPDTPDDGILYPTLDDTPDTPTPEVTPAAPTPTPPVDAAQQAVLDLARSQREFYEQQRQQLEQQRLEQQRQAALAAQPKPLMEQEAWSQRYYDALERASYDTEARAQLARMNQELAREEAQSLVSQQMSVVRLEFQAENLVRSVAATAAQQHAGLVTPDEIVRTAEAFFGGNKPLMAQALQSPEAQQQLVALAIGQKAMSGGLAAKPAPSPPPAVRSNGRTPTVAQPNGQQPWDTEWADSVIEQAFFNPEKFKRGKK